MWTDIFKIDIQKSMRTFHSFWNGILQLRCFFGKYTKKMFTVARTNQTVIGICRVLIAILVTILLLVVVGLAKDDDSGLGNKVMHSGPLTSNLHLQNGNDSKKPMNCIRKLPDVFIIGIKHCGPEALSFFLQFHSQLRMSQAPGLFFGSDAVFAKGLEWYRQQQPCSPPTSIVVKNSPAYFEKPNVPQRIHSMNNSTKFILILKDPVHKVISEYYHLVKKSNKNKPPSLQKVVTKERKKHTLPGEVVTLSDSIYEDNIKNWLKYFPLNQILLLDSETFIKSPSTEISKIEEFLGVEHLLKENVFCYNETQGFYCYCFKKTFCFDNADEFLLTPKPQVNPFEIAKIRDFFHKHNSNFFKLVRRTFNWP